MAPVKQAERPVRRPLTAPVEIHKRVAMLNRHVRVAQDGAAEVSVSAFQSSV